MNGEEASLFKLIDSYTSTAYKSHSSHQMYEGQQSCCETEKLQKHMIQNTNAMDVLELVVKMFRKLDSCFKLKQKKKQGWEA